MNCVERATNGKQMKTHLLAELAPFKQIVPRAGQSTAEFGGKVYGGGATSRLERLQIARTDIGTFGETFLSEPGAGPDANEVHTEGSVRTVNLRMRGFQHAI